MPDFFEGSTVMVTGGCGFIGSHLTAALVARGVRRVIIIDSMRYGDPANLAGLPSDIVMVQHTLGRSPREELTASMAGVDYLFHLAAEKHNQSKDNPAEVFQANVTGTHMLFETAALAGVKKIVFTSSLYAYGRINGAPFVESEVPQPRTVYGISKLAGEHLLLYFNQTHGIAYDVIRYMFVYGPKQFAGMGYKSVIVKNFERLRNGEQPTVYGDGEQALDYVFVDDAVAATLAIMQRQGKGDVFNVGSGMPTTVNKLIETMIDVSGKSLQKLYQPPDWTAGSCRVGDVQKIAQAIGWRPTTDLEAGLSHTWDWIRGSGSPA